MRASSTSTRSATGPSTARRASSRGTRRTRGPTCGCPRRRTALANAHFRLGQHLRQRGQLDEGERFLEEAKRLAPDNWNIWRQAWNLEDAPVSAFWERVDGLGEQRYSLPVDMPGIA